MSDSALVHLLRKRRERDFATIEAFLLKLVARREFVPWYLRRDFLEGVVLVMSVLIGIPFICLGSVGLGWLTLCGAWTLLCLPAFGAPLALHKAVSDLTLPLTPRERLDGPFRTMLNR